MPFSIILFSVTHSCSHSLAAEYSRPALVYFVFPWLCGMPCVPVQGFAEGLEALLKSTGGRTEAPPNVGQCRFRVDRYSSVLLVHHTHIHYVDNLI